MNLIRHFLIKKGTQCIIIFPDALVLDKPKEYFFKTNDLTFKKNDLVLVNTCYGNKVAIFCRYDNSSIAKKTATKYVIRKLNFSIIKNKGDN